MMNRYMKATLLIIIFFCREARPIDPFHALLIPAGIAAVVVMYKQQRTINALSHDINKLATKSAKQEKSIWWKHLQRSAKKLKRLKHHITARLSYELFLHTSLSDSFAHYKQVKNKETLELQEAVSSISDEIKHLKKQDKKNLYSAQLYNLSLERAEQAKINLIRDICWYIQLTAFTKQTPSFNVFWSFYTTCHSPF